MDEGGPKGPLVQVLQDVVDPRLTVLHQVRLLQTRQCLGRLDLNRAEKHEEVSRLKRSEGGFPEELVLVQQLPLLSVTHLPQPRLTRKSLQGLSNIAAAGRRSLDVDLHPRAPAANRHVLRQRWLGDFEEVLQQPDQNGQAEFSSFGLHLLNYVQREVAVDGVDHHRAGELLGNVLWIHQQHQDQHQQEVHQRFGYLVGGGRQS